MHKNRKLGGGSSNRSSGWSRGRAISSGTKLTGSRQTLCPRPLAIAGQPGCKQQQMYGAFHHTEATSELCLPPVSYEGSILVLGCQRNQSKVHKYNPRPTLRGSKPDGRWPAPRPWADRGAIGVPTQPGGFFAQACERARHHFACRTTKSSGGQSRNGHSLRLTKRGSRPQKAQD